MTPFSIWLERDGANPFFCLVGRRQKWDQRLIGGTYLSFFLFLPYPSIPNLRSFLSLSSSSPSSAAGALARAHPGKAAGRSSVSARPQGCEAAPSLAREAAGLELARSLTFFLVGMPEVTRATMVEPELVRLRRGRRSTKLARRGYSSSSSSP